MTQLVCRTVAGLLALSVLGCASSPSHDGGTPVERPATLTYHQLALMDLDEMVVLVKGKIAESRSGSTDAMTPLKEGVRLVYTRPDEDGMIDKVISPLRNEIEEHDDWENVVSGLVDESLAVMRNPEGVTGADQVGHILFLQNMIGSEKSRARRGDPKIVPIFERIRDADIQMTKSMKNERKLRMMKDTTSPSKMAAQALK